MAKEHGIITSDEETAIHTVRGDPLPPSSSSSRIDLNAFNAPTLRSWSLSAGTPCSPARFKRTPRLCGD